MSQSSFERKINSNPGIKALSGEQKETIIGGGGKMTKQGTHYRRGKKNIKKNLINVVGGKIRFN